MTDDDKINVVRLPDGRTVNIHRPGVRATNTSRLSESLFRKYESHLNEAINAWPTETQWAIPSDVSPNTFVVQLRDARKALLMFDYNIPLRERLRTFNDDAVIALDPRGHAVWFRHRSPVGGMKPIKPLISSVSRVDFSSEVIPMPSDTDLTALATLISKKIIPGPKIFRGRVSPTLVAELESRHDIAFAYDDRTDLTTLM